jgi:quercetin dioxygenase-like cupin family protein
MKVIAKYSLAIFIVSPALLGMLIAQQGFTAKTIQTVEGPPGFQTVTGIGQFSAGTCSGRHTHPGIESSYILEGEGIIKIDGMPDQNVKAGEPFYIPAGAIHDACTTSGMKILAMQIIEKGKARVTPVP